MKPYFKGKTASTKPMYSRNVTNPRVYLYETTPQLHTVQRVIFGGANFRGKSDKAPRINFRGFKFHGYNPVYKCAVLCQR